jgi:hypothetical protein
VLAGIPTIRLSIVQLVRDSRACAFSWQRRKERTDVTGNPVYMNHYSLPRSSFGWLLSVSTLPMASRKATTRTVCRYEDFAMAPKQTMSMLAGELGIQDEASFPFSSDRSVVLEPNHFLWGNPDRFRHGATTIRLDDEWRRAMRWRQRALVTAMTFPMLWKYGYLNLGPRQRAI